MLPSPRIIRNLYSMAQLSHHSRYFVKNLNHLTPTQLVIIIRCLTTCIESPAFSFRLQYSGTILYLQPLLIPLPDESEAGKEGFSHFLLQIAFTLAIRRTPSVHNY